MLKNLAKFFIVFLILLLSVEVVHASLFRSFGGKITKDTSKREEAIGRGYSCDHPGRTIEVKYRGNTKIYLIPIGVESKTRKQIRAERNILGLRKENITNIICQKKDEASITIPVYDTIIYGT